MKLFKRLILVVSCTVIFSWVGRWLGKYDDFENLVMSQFYTLYGISFLMFSDILDIKDKLENFRIGYMMVDIKAIKKTEEEAEEEAKED